MCANRRITSPVTAVEAVFSVWLLKLNLAKVPNNAVSIYLSNLNELKLSLQTALNAVSDIFFLLLTLYDVS